MFVEACLEASLPVFLLSIPGQRDEQDSIEARSLAQPFRYLITIDVRQSDIQHNNVRPISKGGFEGYEPLVNHLNVVTGEPQAHAQTLRRVPVIVDDKNSQRAGSHRQIVVRLRDGLLCRLFFSKGEPNDKLASLARTLAASFDPSTVLLNQSLREC